MTVVVSQLNPNARAPKFDEQGNRKPNSYRFRGTLLSTIREVPVNNKDGVIAYGTLLRPEKKGKERFLALTINKTVHDRIKAAVADGMSLKDVAVSGYYFERRDGEQGFQALGVEAWLSPEEFKAKMDAQRAAAAGESVDAAPEVDEQIPF